LTAEARKAVEGLPGLERGGDFDYSYKENPDGLAFIMYLELVDGEGNTVEEAAPETINCVRVSVNWPSLDSRRNQHAVFQLCFSLAKALGWKVYDEQAGEYIRRDLHGRVPSQMAVSRKETAAILESLGLKERTPRISSRRRLFFAAALGLVLLVIVLAFILFTRPPSVSIHQAAARGDLRTLRC